MKKVSGDARLCPRRHGSDQRINTTTTYGRLQFNILATIGKFERELSRERSMEGSEKAKEPPHSMQYYMLKIVSRRILSLKAVAHP